MTSRPGGPGRGGGGSETVPARGPGGRQRVYAAPSEGRQVAEMTRCNWLQAACSWGGVAGSVEAALQVTSAGRVTAD